MKKYIAEFIGTAVLVTFGCGTAMLVGCDAVSGSGYLLTALAFGLAIVACAYSIGNISGCHVNPAVSLGLLVSGRMTGLPDIDRTVINAKASDFSLTTEGLGKFITQWMDEGELDLSRYAKGTVFKMDAYRRRSEFHKRKASCGSDSQRCGFRYRTDKHHRTCPDRQSRPGKHYRHQPCRRNDITHRHQGPDRPEQYPLICQD